MYMYSTWYDLFLLLYHYEHCGPVGTNSTAVVLGLSKFDGGVLHPKLQECNIKPAPHDEDVFLYQHTWFRWMVHYQAW